MFEEVENPTPYKGNSGNRILANQKIAVNRPF